MNWNRIVFVATLCVLSAQSHADQLGYSYLEASYTRPSQDWLSDGRGYAIGASLDLSQSLFAGASYAHDIYHGVGLSEPTVDDYRLGAGWHWGLSTSTDFVAQLSYARAHMQIHAAGALFDMPANNGYALGAGVRTYLTPRLELDAFFDHDTVGLVYEPSICVGTCSFRTGSGASENVGSIGVTYLIWDSLSLGLHYSRSNDEAAARWQASARWYFAK